MGADGLPLALVMLTVKAVAKVLGVSVRSVRTLIALGELPVVRVGAHSIRVSQVDLTEFIERRRSLRRSSKRSRGPPGLVGGVGRERNRPHELVSGGDVSSAQPVEVNGVDRSASAEPRP
jgi:excisionase family DNA binding protein